ncbi:MAG TPA: helix-turn-helix domain-containing protein [Alphaproteobacteria bacterium]|nr:helix-turn-helix domain-containing protein [Alphaproteobacteria bacterium]
MPDYTPTDSLLRLLERQRANRHQNTRPRPAGYQRPAFGTPAYAADYRAGWISDDEFFADEAARMERSARARSSRGAVGAYPARWHRPEPQGSRQYSNPMATTAARDDRLTPQAKALLQVLRARCGRGHSTRTTKGTLAAIMSRHARSIQRYIAELARFGYIEARTEKGPSGLFTGLMVRITEKVTPFFGRFEELAAWLAATPALPLFHGFPEETALSSKNHSTKIPSFGGTPHGLPLSEFAG